MSDFQNDFNYQRSLDLVADQVASRLEPRYRQDLAAVESWKEAAADYTAINDELDQNIGPEAKEVKVEAQLILNDAVMKHPELTPDARIGIYRGAAQAALQKLRNRSTVVGSQPTTNDQDSYFAARYAATQRNRNQA